ncbi:MAG: Uma2 family endonuclease [Anaerolineae bacterium]|nr:Uma2 family endonuclease [Anaerolineae bacterium]
MTVETLYPTVPIALALQQLRHSPQLPRYVQEFESLLQEERARRARFYEEISAEQKAEFINGEVIVHSPARLKHTVASQNLFMILSVCVSQKKLGYIGHEKVLITLTRNDYEPDVVYFCPEKVQEFFPDQVKFPAPDFVAEVLSPSTTDNDRGIKFLDYAAHGVTEYWIIDPDTEVVEQYVLMEQGYELRMKSQTGILQSIAIPGLAIPVRAIFAEDEKLVALQKILN